MTPASQPRWINPNIFLIFFETFPNELFMCKHDESIKCRRVFVKCSYPWPWPWSEWTSWKHPHRREDEDHIVQLGPRSKQSLRFRPKMNTKVAFNTHHHPPTTQNLLNSSRHSRMSKRSTQLNQTKPNPNLKEKNL